MQKLTLFLSFYLLAGALSAKDWIIKDNNITVQLNDRTGLLTVTDNRCSKVWKQLVQQGQFAIEKVVLNKQSLNLKCEGAFAFEVDISLNAGLEIVVKANADASITDFAYPGAFAAPNKNHYLLYTDGGGFLLPITDTTYPLGNGRTYFCGGGVSMSWMGVTDVAFQTGYMAILETPFDAALRTRREKGLVTFSPVWLPSKDKFGYNRKVTYYFFDKGGYVAQAKKYREYIWKKNNVITLKENEKKTPSMAKMIGAVHVYVWDNAREAGFAREMKASGIEKAMFLWDANHTPYPAMGYDDSLKQLGYAAGAYELFTDLKLRDTILRPQDTTGPMRFALTSYPGLFNQLSIKNKDGKTVYNQFGHTANPIAIRPEMQKRIGRELREFKHETYFLDVYQANGLFECYSEKNPLTREQFANAVVENYKMVTDKYGQYLGGEWGADYLGSHAVYNHGMMTLQRTWFGSDVVKKGTIYWNGDWKSNPRPTQMVGTRVAPDTYLRYSINEYTRVPLYDLVYHDAIVSSWRWEDGNHHNPEIWWKKDLFNILYGNAPLWNVDRDRWEAYKNTFIESYKKVAPWLQQVGYDELLNHRFVSADHSIQASDFSSGRTVVVNFGDKPYMHMGMRIEPKGALYLDNAGKVLK